MNLLNNEIVNHIFSKLGIPYGGDGIYIKEYKTQKEILIPNEDETNTKIPIYSAQLKIDNKKFRLLALNFVDTEFYDGVLITHLEDSPIYISTGCFTKNKIKCIDANIYVAIKDTWMECDTYLKALYLAGMEQTKLVSSIWSKSENIDDLYEALLSFLKYEETL